MLLILPLSLGDTQWFQQTKASDVMDDVSFGLPRNKNANTIMVQSNAERTIVVSNRNNEH